MTMHTTHTSGSPAEAMVTSCSAALIQHGCPEAPLRHHGTEGSEKKHVREHEAQSASLESGKVPPEGAACSEIVSSGPTQAHFR